MNKYIFLSCLLSTCSVFAKECICYTPQYYDLKCDCGLFVSVDFLYWYASESCLSYAIETEGIDSGSQIILSPQKFKNFGVDWDPGVRVGVGSYVGCDGFDLYLNWTYYHNSKKNSDSVPEFQDVQVGTRVLCNPWLINSSLFPSFDSIRAKWDFRINQLDLELGRRSWLSPCFNMRPFIALRGAWTDTLFTLNSSRTSGSFENLIQDVTAKDRLKNTFWGVGFLAGLQSSWYFTQCLSLYGNFDIALLWGEYDFRHKAKTLQVNTSTGTITRSFDVESKSDFSAMQAIFDMGIGLSYETTFCDCRYRFTLSTGWEHHAWLDLNHRFKFTSSCSFIQTNNNVGFGGLVIRARFDF